MELLKFKNKLKLKSSEGNKLIFDPIRKKYIILTPEEMIRQLFLVYLIEEEKLPIKHIAVERQIVINKRQFRFDILVFNKKGHPSLIIECKSHKIKLTEDSAIQVSKYNQALKAKHLCITNGRKTLFYKVNFEDKSIEQLKNFPEI